MKRCKLTQKLQIPKGKWDPKGGGGKKKEKKKGLLPVSRHMNQVSKVAGYSVTRLTTRAQARSYWWFLKRKGEKNTKNEWTIDTRISLEKVTCRPLQTSVKVIRKDWTRQKPRLPKHGDVPVDSFLGRLLALNFAPASPYGWPSGHTARHIYLPRFLPEGYRDGCEDFPTRKAKRYLLLARH